MKDHSKTSHTAMTRGYQKKIPYVIIGVLVMIGAIVSAYVVFARFNNMPEKVLADALSNTVADIVRGNPGSSVGILKLESRGQLPYTLSLDFETKSSDTAGAGVVNAHILFAGKSYVIAAAATVIDDEYYFKLDDLNKTLQEAANNQPVVAAYKSYLDPIISRLDNKWVKVTQDDLRLLGGLNKQVVDKCPLAVKNMTLSKTDQKQLKKLFLENQLMVVSETLKSQNIDSESSFHYRLDFNNQAATAFAKNVFNMQSFRAVKAACGITDKELESSFQGQAISKVQAHKPVVELWVGKSSRRPTKFKLTFDDTSIAVDFTSQINLRAKTSKIDKPTDSVPIADLRAEFEKLIPPSTSNL